MLAGCASSGFDDPIRLAPHGDAVRANMAAHIINPTPPARSSRVTDARRTTLATERYKSGEVTAPGEKKQRSLTGAEE